MNAADLRRSLKELAESPLESLDEKSLEAMGEWVRKQLDQVRIDELKADYLRALEEPGARNRKYIEFRAKEENIPLKPRGTVPGELRNELSRLELFLSDVRGEISMLRRKMEDVTASPDEKALRILDSLQERDLRALELLSGRNHRLLPQNPESDNESRRSTRFLKWLQAVREMAEAGAQESEK